MFINFLGERHFTLLPFKVYKRYKVYIVNLLMTSSTGVVRKNCQQAQKKKRKLQDVTIQKSGHLQCNMEV